MAWCKGCGEPIVWVVLEPNMRRAPVDAREVDDGFVPVETNRGNLIALPRQVDGSQVFRVAKATDDEGPRYLNHFASCPQAKRFKRK